MRTWGSWSLLVLGAVVGLAPYWADRGTLRTLTEFLYLLALAQLWNLLAGYGGLLSVGQQAYVGLGSYTVVAVALILGWNPFLGIPLSFAVGLLVALPLGALLFRLRGAYFAVGTWVMSEVLRLLVANIHALGGGTGTSITRALLTLDPQMREHLSFWLSWALGLGVTAGLLVLLRSKYGLAITAVRDNEVAAESLGVSVARIKRGIYLAAAALTTAVGALVAITKIRVTPDAAFSLDWTVVSLYAVIVGGIGTLEGPIVGTLIYFFLRDWLSGLGAWYLITLGVVMVCVMLFMPEGAWGFLTRRFRWQLFPTRRTVPMEWYGERGRAVHAWRRSHSTPS